MSEQAIPDTDSDTDTVVIPERLPVLIDIRPSLRRKDRRLLAEFDTGQIVYFGRNTPRAYIDGQVNDARRRSYIGQHSWRENFDDLASPGACSRWLLWEKRKFSDALKFLAELKPGQVDPALLERAEEYDQYPFTLSESASGNNDDVRHAIA